MRLRGERRGRDRKGRAPRGGGEDGDRPRRPWLLILAWVAYILVLAGGAGWLYMAGPIGGNGQGGDGQGSEHADSAEAGGHDGTEHAGEGSETAAGDTGDGAVPPPPSAPADETATAMSSDDPGQVRAGSDQEAGAGDQAASTAMPEDAATGGEMAAGDQPAGSQAADGRAADGRAATGEMAAGTEVGTAPDDAPPLPEGPPPPMAVDPLRLAQSQPPLPAVPDPDLQEDSVDGVLPRIGPEGQQPWQVYARPFEGEEGRPRIAIVFGALGLDSSGTVRAIEDLPGQVSLSLSPYASSLQDWVAQARSKGHEVLLSLPVQPLGYPASDPGPHALLATQNASEMVSRLRWSLARAGGYVGLSTGIESPVITDARTAEPLLGAVKERGLLFFDGSAASTVTAAELARRDGVPFAAADLVIDATLTPAGIDDALARLESLARQNGQAIGFARAYPISLDRVAGWALSLEAKGISLAPLTALIATPESG